MHNLRVGESEVRGKRVSWVELYFDLIFVFAMREVAHGIVEEPDWARVFGALGLFATLWWTWIGFAVLYNRQGDDRLATYRLLVLAGTIPCAIAATQAHHAFERHPAGFALALAGARLVLAVAFLLGGRSGPEARRTGWSYLASAAIFALSAALDGPWCYVLWAVALVQEAGFLLLGDRRDQPRERSRTARLRALFKPPANARLAVDAGHLAERFGLFMIILLGELVIAVGVAAVGRQHQDTGYWLSVSGGFVLAAALWWVYFDSAADVNERLLRLSGGNPALAYSLYAGGHLLPAFSLLLIAAGVDLSLHEDPPGTAPWFVTVGMAVYFGGTRAFSSSARSAWVRLLRLLATAATVCLALLGLVLPAPGVVVAAAAWAVGAAVLVTVLRRDRLGRVDADPMAFLRDR